VSAATRAELQRLLAGQFESRGWEYDMNLGADIAEEVGRRGLVDPPGLAGRVSGTWLARNRTTREDVAAAIERAIGGRTPEPEQHPATVLTVYNNDYSLSMAPGSTISGGQVNVGGTQINIQADVSKDEVLAGIGALVRAGLDGGWNPEAAGALAAAVDARSDIGFEDVEGVVVEAAEAASEPPDEGRIRGMLRSIAEQGVGGALGTGISAGLGWLLRNPPI
jgi:hypothetical protein